MRREQFLNNSKQIPSARINSFAYFIEAIYTWFDQENPPRDTLHSFKEFLGNLYDPMDILACFYLGHSQYHFCFLWQDIFKSWGFLKILFNNILSPLKQQKMFTVSILGHFMIISFLYVSFS